MANSKPAAWTATLIRGELFRLNRSKKTFLKGEPIQVTPEEKAYLEEHAVDFNRHDYLAEEGREPIVSTPKFRFEPVEDAA